MRPPSIRTIRPGLLVMLRDQSSNGDYELDQWHNMNHRSSWFQSMFCDFRIEFMMPTNEGHALPTEGVMSVMT